MPDTAPARASLFRKELPCIRLNAVAPGTTPRCLQASSGSQLIKWLHCPASEKLGAELERYKTSAYKGGYDYVAWVVTRKPKCELVMFAVEPTERELRRRYGKDLVSVVPL